MLWTLLIKDLRRARHNPWPYLINLALPLCITALIGLVFGPSSKVGGLGQIKVAVIVSKVVLAMAVVVLGSIVMFGGGVLIFGIHWERPLAMAGVILAFGLFGSGFMAFIAALARSERRANAVNGVIVMVMSFVGGSLFPARQLPPLFRDPLSPLMPNYWFIEALRELQSGGGDMPWSWAALKLLVVGLALVIAASWIFRRALAKGIRA